MAQMLQRVLKKNLSVSLQSEFQKNNFLKNVFVSEIMYGIPASTVKQGYVWIEQVRPEPGKKPDDDASK